MVDKSEVVCITVLYNPDPEVVENVDSYRSLVGKTILVDNSNKDNSQMFASMTNVEYIPLMENSGIAHATNVGIETSTEKYILTMDQDSRFSQDLIDAYLRFLEEYDVANIGALTPQYATDRHKIEKNASSKVILLSMQSGTLIKRNVFNEIGLFNEKLFLDVVDWEFFLRMNQENIKMVQVKDAILSHHPAITKVANFGILKLKYGIASPMRYYYQARNLLWTARKYNSLPLYINLIVKWMKIVLLFDNKREYLKMFNRGLKDASSNKLGRFGSKS